MSTAAPSSIPPEAPSLPTGSVSATRQMIDDLKRDFDAPTDAILKQKKVDEASVDTNIKLSNVQHAVEGQHVQFADWDVKESTLADLQKVLPDNPGKKALIAGLQLAIQRQEFYRTNSVDLAFGGDTEKNELASLAVSKLELLKQNLISRASLKGDVINKKQELMKGSVFEQTGIAVSKLGDEFGVEIDAEFAGKAVTAGCVILGIIGIKNLLFGKSEESKANTSLIGGGARWAMAGGLVMGIFGAYNAKKGQSVTDATMEMLKNGKNSLFGDSGSPHAVGGTPVEDAERMGLKGTFGEEVATLAGVDLKTILAAYRKAVNNGDKFISRRDLDISPTSRLGSRVRESDIFDLCEEMFDKSPKERYDKSLTREERGMSGQALIEKWYLNDKFVNEIGRPPNFFDVWSDYTLRDPPPGLTVRS